MKDAVRRRYRAAAQALYFVRYEYGASRGSSLPLRRKLWLWRHGFRVESDRLYDLTPETHHLYVSPAAGLVRTLFINGPDTPLLNDKLLFYHAMTSIGAPTPAVYGMVIRGKLEWIRPEGEALGLMGLLERDRDLVLKPTLGQRARGILFVAYDGTTIRVNGVERDAGYLESQLVENMMVTERVRNGAYAERIAPMATNGIRLITMWDYDRDEPFIAIAVHKFGTSRSAPVDTVDRGGLAARIDLETGVIGPVVSEKRAAVPEWHDRHPETGAVIAGTVVPNWQRVQAELLRILRRIAHIPYVGWDVVVGDDGFTILEGNSQPGTTIQVHGPLLADPRVRRFYEHHGVVRPRLRHPTSGPASRRTSRAA